MVASRAGDKLWLLFYPLVSFQLVMLFNYKPLIKYFKKFPLIEIVSRLLGSGFDTPLPVKGLGLMNKVSKKTQYPSPSSFCYPTIEAHRQQDTALH
jgi:hypothetical protein